MQLNGIGEGGLNDVLVRRLSLTGGAAPATAVEPAIFPTLTLEHDRPEWGWLKGEIPFSAYAVRAGVAAEYASMQLYLPTTSRSIAVITSIVSITVNAFGVARLVGISGALAGWAAQTTRCRDTRANGNGSAVLCETVSNALQPTHYGRIAELVGIGQTFNEPIVLGPGGAIGIFAETVNQAINVTVSWYERQGEPSELV